MLSKLTFIVAAFAAFVAASPVKVARDQCNVGHQNCCNSVQSASSAAAGSSSQDLLNALQGVPLDAMVGIGCLPLSVLALGSSSQCSQQPVCCEHNTENGLVNLGCSPISL